MEVLQEGRITVGVVNLILVPAAQKNLSAVREMHVMVLFSPI